MGWENVVSYDDVFSSSDADVKRVESNSLCSVVSEQRQKVLTSAESERILTVSSFYCCDDCSVDGYTRNRHLKEIETMAKQKDEKAVGIPEEDAMSPGKRRKLQQLFERGNELAKKDKPDFDYAHDLYSQAVLNDPGNLVYVEAMMDNLQRKYKNNKKGGRFSFGGRKAFKAAVAEEDWDEIFREGIEILKTNPWDTQALREMARACAFNRYNEAELRYLKNALDGKPKDVDVNRHCAQSLARMGQFDMAISCWNRVHEKTKDGLAERMMSELTLAKTMGQPASFEAIGATGDRPMAPKPVARPDTESDTESDADTEQDAVAPEEAELEETQQVEEKAKIQLNERQSLERAIESSPADLENYIRLAELHSQSRRYGDAEGVLAKAIDAVGPSLKLETAHEDAQIMHAKARVAIAEQRATSSPSDEADELVKQLRADLNRLELDIFEKRSRRYPEQLRLKYELGVRLRRAGNALQAIKAYEEARHDPNCLVASVLEMGECWQQLKQYAKALKCYSLAIGESSELDGERQKRALYRGAVFGSGYEAARSGEGLVSVACRARFFLQRCGGEAEEDLLGKMEAGTCPSPRTRYQTNLGRNWRQVFEQKNA